MTHSSMKQPFGTDPLEYLVRPKMSVRDLATRDDCTNAVRLLDMDIEAVLAQIADAEASPEGKPRGWRTRAQSAIRWKKRIRQAVREHAMTLPSTRVGKVRPTINDKRQAILETISTEIGHDEFERLVALAKSRHPHLEWATP